MVFLTAVGGKHRIIKRLENDDPMNALAGFGILAIWDVPHKFANLESG